MKVYYSFSSPTDFEALGWIIIAFFGIVCFLSILSYVLGSIGHYRLAKHRGIHHAWLAWVPIGRSWLLGCISDQYRFIARNENKHRRTLLLILNIVLILFSAIFAAIRAADAGLFGRFIILRNPEKLFLVCGVLFIAAIICMLVLTVFTFICYSDLYLSCTPASSDVLLVLSILFPFLIPYFVFAVRNRDGGMPTKKDPEYLNCPIWTAEL